MSRVRHAAIAFALAGSLVAVVPAAAGRAQDRAADATAPPGGQIDPGPRGASAGDAVLVEPVPTGPAPMRADVLPVQLSPRDRTVQPGERLTPAGASRDVATARVGGQDRCDPARPAGGAAPAVCRGVIETRAASYVTEAPMLSPEQRLMAERGVPAERRGLLAEVRLAGRDGVDPNSPAGQALATVALGSPDKAATDRSAATDRNGADPAASGGSAPGTTPAPGATP